jgi:hypothetical protein
MPTMGVDGKIKTIEMFSYIPFNKIKIITWLMNTTTPLFVCHLLCHSGRKNNEVSKNNKIVRTVL